MAYISLFGLCFVKRVIGTICVRTIFWQWGKERFKTWNKRSPNKFEQVDAVAIWREPLARTRSQKPTGDLPNSLSIYLLFNPDITLPKLLYIFFFSPEKKGIVRILVNTISFIYIKLMGESDILNQKTHCCGLFCPYFISLFPVYGSDAFAGHHTCGCWRGLPIINFTANRPIFFIGWSKREKIEATDQ